MLTFQIWAILTSVSFFALARDEKCPSADSYENITNHVDYLHSSSAFLTDKYQFINDIFPEVWKTRRPPRGSSLQGPVNETVDNVLLYIKVPLFNSSLKYAIRARTYLYRAVGNRQSFDVTYEAVSGQPNRLLFVALKYFDGVKFIAALSEIFAVPFISLLPLHNWYSEGAKMPWFLTPHIGQYLKGKAALDLIKPSTDDNDVKQIMVFQEEKGSAELKTFTKEKVAVAGVHVSEVLVSIETAERIGTDVAKGSTPDVMLIDCPLNIFKLIFPFLIRSGVLNSRSVLLFFHDIHELEVWSYLQEINNVTSSIYAFGQCLAEKGSNCSETIGQYKGKISTYDALAADLHQVYVQAILTGGGVFETCGTKLNQSISSKCNSTLYRSLTKAKLPIPNETKKDCDCFDRWYSRGDLGIPSYEIFSQNDGAILLQTLQALCYSGSVGKVALTEETERNCIDESLVEFLVLQLKESWADENSQSKSNWSVVGKWSSNERLKLKRDFDVYPPAKNATKIDRTIRVLSPLSPPFIYGNESSLSGVDVDLVEVIRKEVNFKNVSFTIDVSNRTYSDLIKTVGKGDDWDLAVGALTFSSSRANTSNFTRFYYTSSLSIMVLGSSVNADLLSVMWRFMEPFRWTVWLMILGICAVSTLVTKWLGLVSRYEDGLYLSFITAFYMNENRLVQMRNNFGRIFIVSLCFVFLVIVSSYTANMVSFLTSDASSFSDITGLPSLRSRPVAARQFTSNWRQLLKGGLRNLRPVSGEEEALTRLRNGSVDAFIADTPYLEWIMKTECDVTITGDRVVEQQYAYAANDRFYVEFGEKVDEVIFEAIAEGKVMESYDRHMEGSSCNRLTSTSEEPLHLSNLGGVFIIIAAAAVLCMAIKGGLLWRARIAVHPIQENIPKVVHEAYY
eukprot:m.1993 g.1993  ORF g.1993 m.1993 type:complete len:905 (+) comp8139_c0_seq1:189-2903(+)